MAPNQGNPCVITDVDTNACLTHAPGDKLRLEECGEKKFTILSKWNNKTARRDTCDLEDVTRQNGESYTNILTGIFKKR